MGFIFKIFGKIIPLLTGIIGKVTSLVPLISGKIIGIVAGIGGKLGEKFPKLNAFYTTVTNSLSGIKEKLSGFVDKDWGKVFRNPWVIANGVILVIALSMTAVIVSWFKTQTRSIDDAMETIDQLQTQAKNEVKAFREKKFKIEPFTVKEEVPVQVKGEDIKEDIVSEQDKEIKILIDKATELYESGSYEEALVYYNALNGKESDLIDSYLISLRLGECFYNTDRYVEAINALDKVPKKVNVEYKWYSEYLTGESYLAMGDYDMCRKTFFTLIAMGAKCPPDSKKLVELSYFRVADSFLEEFNEKANIQ